MPFVRLFSAAFVGLEALPVEVEVDLEPKVGMVRIVGLPDAAVKESKDRVLHAIKNSNYSVDEITCTIHLAPAEIKKVGAFYDLPIALGILQGIRAFHSSTLDQYLIGGELGLDGEIRPIFGSLSLSLLAQQLGKKGVVLPLANAKEAALVPGLEIIGLQNLKEAITFFKLGHAPKYAPEPIEFKEAQCLVDMKDIRGQIHAKRALEIAAVGNHNVLMQGAPGSGKSMLSKAFIGILPPLTLNEALEVTNIYSLSGNGSDLIKTRPLRSPHHTISYAGMVGGGSYPKPGEISLAHRGVLFLDELCEFSRATLEVLRQPLEDKVITVSRAGQKITFPTDFICIAAMNPCPCGFLGHPEKVCRDSQKQIDQYRRKISGPFLDRIDIQLDVSPVAYEDIMSSSQAETSETIRKRVEHAQAIRSSISRELDEPCRLLMKEAFDTLSISARAFNRIVNVAQSIAALDNSATICDAHLLEALSYRKQ